MSEPMTVADCRAAQHACSNAVHERMDELRASIQRAEIGIAALSETSKIIASIASDIKQIRRDADALYALKYVEKGFIAVVSLLCLGVLGALLRLVLKP